MLAGEKFFTLRADDKVILLKKKVRTAHTQLLFYAHSRT